jgi:N-acetylglucosaminyl-diphospho-decaprenol L-rhamnosyltransferase
MSPEIDVVTVSWNVRDELLSCLQSVEASVGVTPHIVVVDNDSADGSAEAVATRFPDVRLVRNDSNEGFSKAVNRGAAMGSAPYLLLLNPDTVAPPDALSRLVAHLDALPGHAAVAPRLVFEDGTPQHSAYPFPSVATSLLLGTGLHRLLPRATKARMLLEGSWQSDVERDVPWALGAALLMRRADWVAIGPLDERFFVYAEDLEWCDRAGRQGHPIRFVPDVELVHHGNRSGALGFGDQRTRAHMTNALAFLRRRHGSAWTSAFVGVNAATVMTRYGLRRLAQRVGIGSSDGDRVTALRENSRFYLDWFRGSRS